MTNTFTFSLIALASLTTSILSEGSSYSDTLHDNYDHVTPYSDAGYDSSYPVTGGSYQSNGDYQNSNVVSADQYLGADNNNYADYSNISDTQNFYTPSVVNDYNNGSWERNNLWGCAKPTTQIDYDYNSYLQGNGNWSYMGSNYKYNPSDCDYRVIYSDDASVSEGYYQLPAKQFRQYIKLGNGQNQWVSFNVRNKVILLKSRPANYIHLPNSQIYTNDQFSQDLYEHVFKRFSHNNYDTYNDDQSNYNGVDDYINNNGGIGSYNSYNSYGKNDYGHSGYY